MRIASTNLIGFYAVLCRKLNMDGLIHLIVHFISLALYSNDYAKYVRFINGLKWIVMPHACFPTWHLWLMIIHRKLHSTVMIVFSSILYLVVCPQCGSQFFHIRCYNHFYCIFSVFFIRYHHILPTLFYQISLHILLCLFLFSLTLPMTKLSEKFN